MAKKSSSSSNSVKMTFGVRRKGKHAKRQSPKAKAMKKYQGQGR